MIVSVRAANEARLRVGAEVPCSDLWEALIMKWSRGQGLSMQALRS
jgi:hypothetical protein